MDVVRRVGVRILTGWGMYMPSPSPIIAQISAAGINGYALIDACGCRIPCLDEIGWFLYNDGSSILIKRVADRQAVKRE